MGPFRYLIAILCICHCSLFAVTGNINVQFLLGDTENGTFQGTYHITFGLYATVNASVDDALWSETHEVVVTQGKVSQLLGTITPISYHDFKSDSLYMGLSFDYNDDRLFVPVISVPASVVSKYSMYAQEIEFTSDWMKIDTPNHRVGIGITQNLTVPFEVVGTANITTLNVSGQIISPDGYNIEKLNYEHLVNLDDYSLSPDDNLDTPTVDVVYVTNTRRVGIGFLEATSDIKEHLHVSGNLQVDHGTYFGKSDIQLVGTVNVQTIGNQDGPQLLWDSKKQVFRAGYSSGTSWHLSSNGAFSAAFGSDNNVTGKYSFAAGKDNLITNELSTIPGGQSNELRGRASGILSGDNNRISNTGSGVTNGFMVIAGGKTNKVSSDFGFIGGGQSNVIESNAAEHSAIIGGQSNHIKRGSTHSTILGGSQNYIYGNHSMAFGRNAQIGSSSESTDGVFMFADSNLLGRTDQYLRNRTNDQFLVYATNGVLIGLLNDTTDSKLGFDHTQVITLSDFNPPRYYPPRSNCVGDAGCIQSPNDEEPDYSTFSSSETGYTHEIVKNHTLRVAGDIVAVNENDRLGYLVGDGRFITNISSLWLNDEQKSTIYTETKRIGIGAKNDLDPPTSLLYIQENDQVPEFPPNIHIESMGGGQLHVGVAPGIGASSGYGIMHSTDKLEFNQGLTPTKVAELTTNADFWVKTQLGVKIDVPTHDLHVDGTTKITGELTNDAGIVSHGSITTNAVPGFVGDGSLLTNVPVYYMSPQGVGPGDPLFQQLMMDITGQIGLGFVTQDIKAMIHVGSSLGNSVDDVHLRLENDSAGLGDNEYSTFKSTSKLDMTFHSKSSDNPVIFSINSATANANVNPMPLFHVSRLGHVGVLTDPHSGNAMSVSGNIHAETFQGSGAQVTDVQLDVPQQQTVTFDRGITVKSGDATMASFLKLEPHAHDDPPTCSLANVGAVYTIYNDSSSGEISLCVCVGDGAYPKNLTGGTVDDCQ